MKKRRLLSGAILGLLFTAAMPLSAEAVEEADFKFNSTRDLYDLCSVKADDPNFIPANWACRGFLEGAVQYHDGVCDEEHLKRLICYQPTTTISDGIAVFISWGENNLNNTEYMNELPVIGVVRALSEKYPCAE
ncbi:MAG: hypothetical protein GQ559_03025 [Desulfobulbaceae bacterium]|nr:hypothetical protein [Desulfobulbaceae bacterium]